LFILMERATCRSFCGASPRWFVRKKTVSLLGRDFLTQLKGRSNGNPLDEGNFPWPRTVGASEVREVGGRIIQGKALPKGVCARTRFLG